MQEAIYGVIGLVVGAGIGFFVDRLRLGAAYQNSEGILKQAQLEADNLKKTEELAAKEILLKRREELEAELNVTRDELREHEKHLDKRESKINDQQDAFRKKEQMLQSTQTKLAERSKAFDAKEKELERSFREVQDQLYKISGLDKETASKMLLERLDRELANETGALVLKHEADLKGRSEELSREILGMAVQRCASTYTTEATVSTVDIPSDEMKGRIIGREGRNIRAFEKETGVRQATL